MMEAKRSQIKKGAGSLRHKFFLPETLLCDISSELLQLPAPILKLQIIASSTTCFPRASADAAKHVSDFPDLGN